MNQEFITLIEKLATQLGQTAESMWHILIAQARIAAIINFILGGILTLTAMILILISLRAYKDRENDTMTVCVIASCVIIASVIIVISIAFWLPAFTAHYNPEYWALQKLINMI